MRKRTAVFSFGLVVSLGVGAVYGADWWQTRQFIISTDNAYVRGNLTVISARIDGYVEDVHVDAHQPVRAGEPLVTFRADQNEAEVDTARAELRAAAADVETGKAAVANMQARRDLQQSLIAQSAARVTAARAQSDQATRELERQQKLMERGSGSRQKQEQAMTDQATRAAEVSRTRAEQAAAHEQLPVIDTETRKLRSEIARLEAELAAAAARLDRAEIALSDTVVAAPVDGVIGVRKVEPGMYMEAGWPMMSLVSLDVTWVVANVKETQLANLRVGQLAEIRFDAFPKQPMIGRVHSLSPASAAEFSVLPAQNATGNFIKVVQRIPVKITYDLPAALVGRVVPGMSVVVTIDTRSAPDGPRLAGMPQP